MNWIFQSISLMNRNDIIGVHQYNFFYQILRKYKSMYYVTGRDSSGSFTVSGRRGTISVFEEMFL